MRTLTPTSTRHFKVARCLTGIKAVEHEASLGGASCVGLMKLFYERMGFTVELPRYESDWYVHVPSFMADHISWVLRWPRLDPAEPLAAGDLLLFKVLTDVGDHPGAYLGGRRFLHSAPSGSEITEFSDGWWRLLAAVYRPCPVEAKLLGSSCRSRSAP